MVLAAIQADDQSANHLPRLLAQSFGASVP